MPVPRRFSKMTLQRTTGPIDGLFVDPWIGKSYIGSGEPLDAELLQNEAPHGKNRNPSCADADHSTFGRVGLHPIARRRWLLERFDRSPRNWRQRKRRLGKRWRKQRRPNRGLGRPCNRRYFADRRDHVGGWWR